MKTKILRVYYTILAKLSHHYISRHKPKIIGINGSVGKTSCRMIIYQILTQSFPDTKIYSSPKNFNGELGLSLSVFQIENREPSIVCFIKTLFFSFFISVFGQKKYDIIVLEYGIDTPGEMEFILQVAKPDIGVFTAIDAVHSEQFGSPANIANEEILMALNTKELVFLNANDPYAMQLLPQIQVDKLTYQTNGWIESSTNPLHNNAPDLYFSDCHFDLGNADHEIHSSFTASIKGKEKKIRTNLIGKPNYGYITVALTIAEILSYQSSQKANMSNNKTNKKEPGVKIYNQNTTTIPETIKMKLQPGRLSIFAGINNTVIFDSTYNASPRSIREIINTVYSIRQELFPSREIRLILGDMRELGELTETEHRQLAGYISQIADQVFLLGTSMNKYLADELSKIGFDMQKLNEAKSRKDLNEQIKSKLSSHNKQIKDNKAGPLLVFKGSQNTIFLEESVKHFLKNTSDIEFLTRQSKFWLEKK